MIYFFDLWRDGRVVRVGFDGSAGSTRIADHRRKGQELLAALPGSQDFEDRIHVDFRSTLAASVPGQTSCYEGPRIWEYVAWLLARGYAATNEDDARHFPILPWDAIDPARVDAWYDDQNGQRCLVPPSPKERVKLAAQAAYHKSESDEWYTPQEIVDSARAVLGEIDLDPASCPKANERVRARAFYSRRVDGLAHPWSGRVWMNPPYGNAAPVFAERLIAEYEAGRVTEAVALFNANAMSSLWFSPIYKLASALLITRGRLQFEAGDPSQAFSSPATGSVVVYLGARPEAFHAEFAKHGTTLTVYRDPTATVMGTAA
jgi:phage N-6-adenine-methyltransferase